MTTTTATLATIRDEQLKQSVVEIGHQLQALYQQAQQTGDQQALSLIADAWNRTQILGTLAQTTTDQRDSAMQELSDLISAINRLDLDNELVASIYEIAQEYEYENLEEQVEDDLYSGLLDIYTDAIQALDPRCEDHLRDAPIYLRIKEMQRALMGEKVMNMAQMKAYLNLVRAFVWEGDDEAD